MLLGGGIASFLVAGHDASSGRSECAASSSCSPPRTAIRTFDAVALGAWIGAAGLGRAQHRLVDALLVVFPVLVFLAGSRAVHRGPRQRHVRGDVLMRRVGLLVASAGTMLAALLGTACVDLFHSTDFGDACSDDPSSASCADASAHHDASTGGAGDGAVAPGSDGGPPLNISPGDPLCSGDPTVAAARVNHACAYLSECGGALGVNAPSACVTAARTVYDCRVAPERPTIGAAGTFWRCVANATSCDAITSCIEPDGPEQCEVPLDSTYVNCESAGDPPKNVASRISCDQRVMSLTGIENCDATGRGCGNGVCTVSIGSSCVMSTCSGAVLHACDDAGADQGVDCNNFGAGGCAFDTDSGALGCTTTGAACTPTAAVTCDSNGVAHGCPAGTSETVDCVALTGLATADACTVPAAAPGTTWDVSRACSAPGATCNEQCGSDGKITACVLGQPATIDCSVTGTASCANAVVAGDTHPICAAE